MNQNEQLAKQFEIQYHLREVRSILNECAQRLDGAIWYCKKSIITDDGDRNTNLNNDAELMLEKVERIYDYWQEIYDDSENY